jgi:hypothetical protein
VDAQRSGNIGAVSEKIIYKGHAFYRYPESENWAERSYYTPSHAGRKKGLKRLHQEIWQDVNECEIPDGFLVHHYDEDTLNNDPRNLVLVTAKGHAQHHVSPEKIEALKQHLEKARAAAAVWHGSEEGRAWHVEHAKRVYARRELATFACDHCGEDYETRDRGKNRFCSNKCKSRARRASGVDDVERQCAGCGEAFTVNKYEKTTCCSKKCAWTVRRLKA